MRLRWYVAMAILCCVAATLFALDPTPSRIAATIWPITTLGWVFIAWTIQEGHREDKR